MIARTPAIALAPCSIPFHALVALGRNSGTPVALALVALAIGGHAAAAPAVGFIEEFPGTSTASWFGGTPFSNPGTGGFLGAGDGYLLLENSVATNFGSASSGPEYQGNWTAAGITQVRIWLNDVGAADPLEIHFSIGDGDPFSPTRNFWQYNVGFTPPLHAWGEFVVDLTSGANWTQILGSGTFANALTMVNRVHLRHDPAPYDPVPHAPDPIRADVGIDHILLTNSSTPARATSWGRIKTLYR